MAGQCVPAPNCAGLPAKCGPAKDESCCATATTLPGGASEVFYRVCDASKTTVHGTSCSYSYPATVSSFRLDRFEVTVGRFRAFVEAYNAWRAAGHPKAGEGGDPNLQGGSSAWDPSWPLPASASALINALSCGGGQSWALTPTETSETLPMNCVTWAEAMAFCTWDEGWLPTEAQWAYAAAGGGENRAYPWSVPPASLAVNSSMANYNGNVGAPVGVGSYPAGQGKWGHLDLGGNVYEWVFDGVSADPPGLPSVVCNDCADFTAGASRRMRGGYYTYDQRYMRSSFSSNDNAAARRTSTGFRCARKP